MPPLLTLLGIRPSAQSLDYLDNRTQFQLHTLLTEQSHPATRELGRVIREDTEAGLNMLLSVDRDISDRLRALAKDTKALEMATQSVCRAIRNGHRIYVYGCGATGRLAKQMESAFWRPFWRNLRSSSLWPHLSGYIPEDIEERLTGEMTGGDRALVSSLEGFEDLELIGRLQLQDHRINKGDVVFCITEGGETSSVIGTILAARMLYGNPTEETNRESRQNLWFLYNNPDELLLPFSRSRSVILNGGISKINLSTGPQAIAGSTRMQATTIETFVMGCILEQSITCSLREKLDPVALASLGLDTNIGLSDRLLSFIPLQERVESQAGSLTILTDRETAVYRTHRHTTCFAVKAMTTVFTDSTERSPTFRLSPLDTTATPVRKSWIRVLTGAPDGTSAWQSLLGREFRGMEESFYRPAFEAMTGDPWLREAALKSLARAGNDEREHYDFSFEGNIKAGLLPVNGDLCLAVGIDREAAPENDNNQAFSRFLTLAEEQGATTAALQVWHKDTGLENTGFHPDIRVSITLPNFPDPLNLRAQVALKMMLNAHSTAIMAKLGRITGNTMTWVSPSNLKLIGRATSLILMHVNRMLDDERPHGIRHITYAEANAVLFDCIENHPNGNGQSAEVALCIIRIVESLRRQEGISWEETARMLEEKGLEGYLEG